MSRSCQPVTKNSDFCNEVNNSTIFFRLSSPTRIYLPGFNFRESRGNYNNIIAPPMIEIDNKRILYFAKSPKITNSRKYKHAKITRSTVLSVTITCPRWAGALGWWLAPLPFTSSWFGSRSRRFERKKMFLPHPCVKLSIVGNLLDER